MTVSKDFASAGAAFPRISVSEFVTAQCHTHSDKIAIEVIETGARLTYSELHKRIEQAAGAFCARGIGKGDRVALQLNNGWEYPVLWLALARIGAVHVPVNTRYSAEEISYVLRDSGAALMVVSDDLATPDVSFESTVSLSDFKASFETAQQAPTVDLSSDDLLNIQYTSGTTGLPKGCMLSHDYWLVLARAAAVWDAEPVKRILSAQPFFYMDPQWITLKTLLNGATMFIAPGLSSSRFLGWLIDYNIEWCMFPIVMARLPRTGQEGDTVLKQCATFGWDPETCARFHSNYGVTAREGFGMTEIGLGTAMPAAQEDMRDSASTGLVGPCRETSVRRPDGSEAAPNEAGELWVRGRSIFQGYWNRPDATADACPGDGWFRTGDIFVKNADGFHWITGRIKDMIRRSSENIAAREVEAALCTLPQIIEAAALAEPDAMRGEEVLAILQKSGSRPAEEDVETFVAASIDELGACLAVFKQPRYWAFVDSYPRTASNKIQKAQLRESLKGTRAFDRSEGRWITLA